MTLETLAKENLNFYAPKFDVEIEGKKLDVNISEEIIDITVNEKLNEGVSFELTLYDEFDMKTQKFKWTDDPRFYVGNKITIKIGYGSNLQTMIDGRISSLEPSFFNSEKSTLKIKGYDVSYNFLKRPKPERTFEKETYSDIVRTIAQEAGLDCVVDNTGKTVEFIRKDNKNTYYEFLDDIKTKIGFVFYIEERKIYFIKQKSSKEEILTLELGKDIISFSPIMKTTGLLAEVIVRGHNPQDPNNSFIGEAKAEGELLFLLKKMCSTALPKKVITNVIVESKEQANEIAKAELTKASYTYIEGDVECIGLPQIRADTSIVLSKMGERFSNKYYVTKTSHTIDNNGYRTRFSVISNSVKKAMT
jgi:phage protein D